MLPSRTIINPSILSNLIHNGFGHVYVLYEMSETKTFLYDFISNKILLKLMSVPLVISSK